MRRRREWSWLVTAVVALLAIGVVAAAAASSAAQVPTAQRCPAQSCL